MTDRELINRWRGNQRYTLRIIEAMPEESFDFKPIEGAKSFRSQASHITTWLRTNFRHISGHELNKAPTANKREILQALGELFDQVLDYLSEDPQHDLEETVKMWYGKCSKAGLLATMDNHLSHHRGQMVIYLRLEGVQPPSYVGW
ncbi:MAG: DinB family protein [Bacteroidota bacterium]